jgi:hypothetical protein
MKVAEARASVPSTRSPPVSGAKEAGAGGAALIGG